MICVPCRVGDCRGQTAKLIGPNDGRGPRADVVKMISFLLFFSIYLFYVLCLEKRGRLSWPQIPVAPGNGLMDLRQDLARSYLFYFPT